MITVKTLDICYEILSELEVNAVLPYLATGNCDIEEILQFQDIAPEYRTTLRARIINIDQQSRIHFVNRIIHSKRTLRNSINPRYRFDERWNMLNESLLLDGYIIDVNVLQEQDIIISEIIASEDLLYSNISGTGLGDSEEIIRLLKNSKDDFINPSPDYNACLINIRTPLESLVKAIAEKTNQDRGDGRQLGSWGSSLSYLRSVDFVNSKDEALLSSTYSLLSELHRPVYLSEKEMTKYARSLGLSAIWYISNIYNNYLAGASS